jgi:hypothetical protein
MKFLGNHCNIKYHCVVLIQKIESTTDFFSSVLDSILPKEILILVPLLRIIALITVQ